MALVLEEQVGLQRPRISVVIPARNEAQNLSHVLSLGERFHDFNCPPTSSGLIQLEKLEQFTEQHVANKEQSLLCKYPL